MEPLSTGLIGEQELISALEAESVYQRIWLPPEPWWDSLVADKEKIARAVHRMAVRGSSLPRAQTVDVRKPGHGVRPISIMTPEVRVLYRALAEQIVPEDERVDRSAERYADFVTQPVRAAFNYHSGPRRVGDAKYSHIVVADVAAFYQYVDHGILRDELDLAGADIDLVDALVGLLDDIEGRSFGIPQRSEPSDWISEVYAQRLDRWVVRDGFDVWRYNDDFRIGSASYAEALRAIEVLARAARDVGLALNDQKTATPTFLTYLGRNIDVVVHDASTEIDPSDVEAAVSPDYPAEDDDQLVADAQAVIENLWDPGPDHEAGPGEEWNLRSLSVDEHRAVRRALSTLTKHRDRSALPVVFSIVAYQPAMTHLVGRYVEAMPEGDDAVESFLDSAIARLSLNEWQRAWLAHAFRVSNLRLADNSSRLGWLRSQLNDRRSSLAAAEAAVTLAGAAAVDFKLIESSLRTVSADLAPWYLHAVSLLYRQGRVTASEIGALRQSSAVAAAILS